MSLCERIRDGVTRWRTAIGVNLPNHWVTSFILCLIPAISYGSAMTVSGQLLDCYKDVLCTPFGRRVTDVEGTAFVTWMILTHIIFTFWCGSLIETYGSRAMLVSSCFIAVFGWNFLLGYRHIYLAYLGRAILGMASGLGVASAYTHLDEIATPANKGQLNIFFTMTLNLGSLISLLLSYFFDATTLPLMLLLFPWSMVVCRGFLAEGPQHSVRTRTKESTFDTLLKLRPDMMSAMREFVDLESENMKRLTMRETFSKFKQPEVFLPFILMSTLMFFQVSLGNDALTYFNVDLLRQSGIENDFLKIVAISQVIFNAVGYLAGGIFFKSMTRRRQILFFGFWHGLAMALVGVFTLYSEILAAVLGPWLNRIVATFLLSLPMFFYGSSYGSVCFGMLAEVFPPHVKPVLCSIVLCFRYTVVYCNMQVMGSLMKSIPMPYFFFFFAFITFVGNCVVYFIPETSRKSSAEIKNIFLNAWNKWFPSREPVKTSSVPENAAIHPSSNGNEADLEHRLADFDPEGVVLDNVHGDNDQLGLVREGMAKGDGQKDFEVGPESCASHNESPTSSISEGSELDSVNRLLIE
ncbi:hypothetical protein TCAL_03731 [Tigriopus californicus]|uniref:Major facilitator superfamily (MFS) profile domain-containing protein n=1 Tax=Tigriopus californicus TaxID=6832 RepID=A0A553NPW7_TIGCA|nr:uncharacterized protein LOC131878792 [Tigriopus californicus]TRY67454.1 hypothetical protein TCAL_03731 [Tigriopus californicus]|eukprot:TCALIF_03731-PA protein Name:"Similar to STP8 Sugar transport protein 8 (Arabidopsis thaliana)" AED:0.01 eAED:0.01 QI:257/1/1/1/0.5/0.6/5/71/579